jgi:hypothetical protein
MNLPKRLPYEALIAAVLTLGSCSEKSDGSKFTMEQRDEIRDLAREATAQDRDRLDAIEEKLNMQNGEID